MTVSSLNTTATIDPSTPFCAKTYFQGLREAGVRPYARSHAGRDSSGLCYDDGDASVRARPWHRWAREQDPNQKLEGAYIIALLDRHRHTEDDLVIIQLGICDDEIQPEIHQVPMQAFTFKTG